MATGILDTDIYCITSEVHSLGRSNTEVVQQMIKAGVTVIQYREKEKSMKAKYEECRRIRELTSTAGVNLIVNDHVDLAIAVGADGIHIGQDDLPVDVVRRLIPDDMIIGLSTHSPEQAEKAVALGVDYIGVGPIFETHTKVDVCAPVGLEYLDYVVAHHTIPFVAIGGIKENTLGLIKDHGASCAVLVTDIVGADSIQEKIWSLKQIMASQ